MSSTTPPPPSDRTTLLERARRDAAEREPPWNDVRERRVLGRIKQARAQAQQPVGSRWAWLTPPRLGLGVAVAGAAAAVALVFAAGDVKRVERVERVEPAVLAPPTQQQLGPIVERPSIDDRERVAAPGASRMRLPDGSVAQLGPGAHVEVVDLELAGIGSDDRVALEQTTGEVRYEVTHDAAREFIVRSKGVEIRVIGTVFSVVAGDARVFVEVEHGRVLVIAGERRSELGPGDSLGVGLGAGLAPARTATVAKVPIVNVDALLDQIDAARAKGDLGAAAKLLRELLGDHPGDPRATTAAFTLGRVERSRGHHRAAAEAFADYLDRAPTGALAEDALAEQARSWSQAGEPARAVEIARRSLERWPDGTHRARMRELAGE